MVIALEPPCEAAEGVSDACTEAEGPLGGAGVVALDAEAASTGAGPGACGMSSSPSSSEASTTEVTELGSI